MPTLLMKKVRCRRILFPAWDKVHSAGRRSPSKDTQRAVAQFAENEARNLERIQEDLRKRNYEFAPGAGVPIKRDGKDPRPIVVQDVRDRVVQRSLLDVVMEEKAVSKTVDHGTSFGGIPKRRVTDALKPILDAVRGGHSYFIRSDIKNFFGSMPRSRALECLISLLPDRSLDEFLDQATRTELSNRERLGHLIGLFPDLVTGVPQGHALSALLGNLLLRNLDRKINEGGVLGIRYLDDFVILGPDRATTWKAFKRAREELSCLGLTCYSPGRSMKAAQGGTRQMFEFLGCEISPEFVRPSRENREGLLNRVEERIQHSISAMQNRHFGAADSYDRSVVSTLRGVSLTLRGWSEQYSFCNYGDIRRQMDKKIDDTLSRYFGIYGDVRAQCSETERRRMAGVWLLSDAEDSRLLGIPS